MTQFKEGQVLRREIHVYHIDCYVQVEITAAGLSFHIKGSRKSVSVGWGNVVRCCFTGDDVPSFLAGKPFELLQHEALKVTKKKSKKNT